MVEKIISGHMTNAEGSIGFRNEERRLLIGGDMLIERITPNITFSYDDEQNPLQQYFDTLILLRKKTFAPSFPATALLSAAGRIHRCRDRASSRAAGQNHGDF